MRGATFVTLSGGAVTSVSIHAPRAGRDAPIFDNENGEVSFNPRAPCGARQMRFCALSIPIVFQSTRPVRGATTSHPMRRQRSSVSIHAPRAGRDVRSRSVSANSWSFNPRAPCGARQIAWNIFRAICTFQSTRPVRGATNIID